MIESKFLKIRCQKCKNEQITFGKCSTKIRCLICRYPLIKTSGGKAKIKAMVKEIL